MRIDSYDLNLLTGADRFPVDDSALPQDPVVIGDLDVGILVHEDVVDYDFARGVQAAGMPPYFGTDGIEVPPVPVFEPGLDGEALRVLGMAAVGFQADGLEQATGPTAVQPFTLGIEESDNMVASAGLPPYLDPLAFLSDDGLDIRALLANPQAPPPIGQDGMESYEPDWDAQIPQLGEDHVWFGATALPAPQLAHARDGIELPGRAQRVFGA
jgi:hypothetical protein